MPARPRPVAAGLAVLAALALAPAAGAATLTVRTADFMPSIDADLQAFYPQRAIVRQGDAITFRFSQGNLHTVSFVPPGTAVPRDVVPLATAAAPLADPAGAPFWWGGTLPVLTFNPKVLLPTRARAVNGRAFVSSGFPNRARFTFTVRFPRAGTFRYACLVHRGMKGEVSVVPRRASVPTPAAQAARGARENRADRLVAARLDASSRATVAAAPTEVLAGAGVARLSLLAFLPRVRTVKAGTTVRFRWTGVNEIHTVTFGPRDFVDGVERNLIGPPPGFPIDLRAAYPTDPPGAPPAVTPTSHGNGFLGSGILGDPPTGPPPHSFSVTFPTPGRYDYRCVIHPGMDGTVVVTP